MKKQEDSLPRRWIKCSVEEEHMGEERKEGKIERKMAKAKDRSKYKKSDREKYLKGVEKDKQAKLGSQEWLEGRVLSIVPQGILVESEGEKVLCVLKGVLKKEKTDAKNLVTVGDQVWFEKREEGEGIIGHVLPRRTLLSRADNLARRKEQLIAANVDLVVITASVVQPILKPAILDRYIIAARKGGMEPLIVVNKIDLLDEEDDSAHVEQERTLYAEAVRAYGSAGIPLIGVSTVSGRGMKELKQAMRDKVSVFSGQSGVGKSSLINAVVGTQLRVGHVVEKTKKGTHTTTTTCLLPLDFGGWCVDTPGIRSFGVWNLELEEVEGYFEEIHRLGLSCKFADCTHLHEVSCAVLMALEAEELSFMRYASYQALRASVAEQHQRR